MPVQIAPYSEHDIPAVKEFNRRLKAGGAPEDHVFSESHIAEWLPPGPDVGLYNEYFLALEEGVVRGTYVLKHQEFSFRGEVRPVVYYHHPFSEGIIDKRYTQVGLQMLMHVMRANPLLYALGMGGYDRPLPRMLMALKWDHCTVPFYFRVNHPSRFLRNMQAIRRSGPSRAIADLAAITGVGWFGLKTAQAVLGLRAPHARAEATVVQDFGDWADEIWSKCAPSFAMCAVRDSRSLRAIYPASCPNFTRLKITASGRTLGWAVLADLRTGEHPQYGNLRVGTIVDGLSAPEDAALMIAAAARAAEERDVDVIVSNQSHSAWTQGLKRCGFFPGPSNFIFASSKKLSGLLDPFHESFSQSQWNRGDGDSVLKYV